MHWGQGSHAHQIVCHQKQHLTRYRLMLKAVNVGTSLSMRILVTIVLTVHFFLMVSLFHFFSILFEGGGVGEGEWERVHRVGREKAV